MARYSSACRTRRRWRSTRSGEVQSSASTLQEIPLGAGWKAALAVAGAIRDVRYWTLDAAVSGR
jgi:hypothetical protein